MTKMPEQLIRVYKKDPDGNLHDAREDFCVSDFLRSRPACRRFHRFKMAARLKRRRPGVVQQDRSCRRSCLLPS